MASKNSKGKRIAIIGAGAGGLAAARYLLTEGCRVSIFERKAGPGGVWNTEPANRCGPNPVYEGLETNVPRNLMTFSDLQWPTSVSLFPQSSQVNEYLHTYAAELRAFYPNNDDFTLYCNTEVVKLRKGTHNTMPQWKIEAEAHYFGQAPDSEKLHFDAVVVAIGNYHKFFVPKETPGFGDWARLHPGSVLHSVHYKKATDFKNKTVLIVGNSASGWDISAQVATNAKKVIVSTRRYDVRLGTAQVSPGSEPAPGVQCFDPATRSVEFTDGRVETGIDYIIFCTGYVYDFAFIKECTGINERLLFKQGLQVKNVYKHLFYTKDPSLAFVGLPTMVPVSLWWRPKALSSLEYSLRGSTFHPCHSARLGRVSTPRHGSIRCRPAWPLRADTIRSS